MASTFHPGGYVLKGEPVVMLEREDFEHALAMQEAALQHAEAELAIEQGQRRVAKNEFQMMDEIIDEGSRDLVLREPQLQMARASVASAKAAVAQARLNLSRTRIAAPFDAQVLTREVNVGSQVSPGETLARLAGVDRYWVATTIKLKHLDSIQLPEGVTPGATARIHHRNAWPKGVYRDGVVDALIGELESDTRMATLLVGVADPLATASDAPALIIDSIVEVQVEGKALNNVVRLDRDYVRAGPAVWLYEEGKLAIRPVTIVTEDADFAYLSSGLENGDEVVTTSLATAAAGVHLKRIEAATNAVPEEADP
jgi:RND family efflux transporter MFP subunit